VVTLIAVTYAASVGMVRFLEQRQLYAPDVDRTLVAPREQLGLPVERVELMTRDSITLVGWVIPGERTQSVDDSPIWLLICKGNQGNIAAPARLQHYAALRQLGLNILAFDYRGYGESNGKPTEAGLYLDADAAYRYLRETRGIPASRIILFGHSLGSAVAIDLAVRVPVAGLIVEGAFTSVVDRAQELYSWAPVRWLPVSRFASLDKVDRIRAPKLFLHATADGTIPIAHGRHLYERAVPPKEFVELRGGHGDAFEVDSATYFESIARFASEVTRSNARAD
jgi:pimeloyl-ACP methyl ester carboxylesterase